MKIFLLAGAALVVLVPVSAPRANEPALTLGIGGYMSLYSLYVDQDDNGTERRGFDFRKDTEIVLKGEAALDNGITAGAQIEIETDRADAVVIEASYLYLSSDYGRVHLGEGDGITYLLQVSAPSADDNIDGVRPDIGIFAPASNGGTLNYAHDDTSYSNKLTYITPLFSGFQAGISFTPSVSDADLDALGAAAQTDDAGEQESDVAVAARYEASFEAVDVMLGTGYSVSQMEAGGANDDDRRTWNAGAGVEFGGFELGAAYLATNNALSGNSDSDSWAVGSAYTTGAYKFGVSYLNQKTGEGALAGPADFEADRWTAGAIYEWGPGMSFRGAVQFQAAENLGGVAGADGDGTLVSFGTQLEF